MKKGSISVPYYNYETHKQESKEVPCLIADCGLAVHRSIDTWLTQHQTSGYSVTHIQSGKRVLLTVTQTEAKVAVEKLSDVDWNVDINTLSQLVTLKQKLDMVKEELGL